MKHLIAFTALTLFLVNANAVTAAKSSSNNEALDSLKAVAAPSPQLAALKKAQAANQAPPVSNGFVDTSLVSAPAKPSVANTEALIPQEKLPEASIETTESDLTIVDDNALEAQTMANVAAQESTTYVDVMPKRKEKPWYISGSIGTIGYPDVSNVTGQYSASMSAGYIMNGMFMFEIGAGIAQYKMDSLNPTILNRMDHFDVDQYSVLAAAKYRYAFGRVVPNGGVILQLTQRNFLQRDPNNIGNNSVTIDKGNSQTTDAGFVGGVDFEMNRDFAIGVELKYLTNLANSAENIANVNSNTQTGYNVTPIEKLQSYSAGVSARMNF